MHPFLSRTTFICSPSSGGCFHTRNIFYIENISNCSHGTTPKGSQGSTLPMDKEKRFQHQEQQKLEQTYHNGFEIVKQASPIGSIPDS